jgi:protein tyrosine/serine phosphatase
MLFSTAVALSAGDTRPAAPAPPGACLAPRLETQRAKGPRGIENFGMVTPSLYRGGQPTTEGFRELKQLGVTIVVSFRHEKGENSLERRTVESLDMRFISLPWNAFDAPTDGQVRAFLELLRDNPDKRIYVHCQQGRDRTGTMIALYRIAADHWCPDSAVAEMHAYHYHHFWFPHLETYVRRFPQRLATDTSLAGLVAAGVSP